MFLIPAGIMLGANISISNWWPYNQIPVTVGNIVGGSVFTGLALYLTYRLKKSSAKMPDGRPETTLSNGRQLEIEPSASPVVN